MNGSNLRHSRSSSKSSLVSASSSCHLPRSDSILSDISNQDENKKSAQSALNKENLVRRSNSVLGDKERKQKREHTGTNLKGMRVKRVSASQGRTMFLTTSHFSCVLRGAHLRASFEMQWRPSTKHSSPHIGYLSTARYFSLRRS